jgi:hypothetical protein
MSMNDFDIVDYLEESLSDSVAYLAALGDREKAIWGRNKFYVVRSNASRSFIGEIPSGDYAMRFNAVECRLFTNIKTAEAMAEAFREADIKCEVLEYREALETEMKETRESIPETKKALLKAQQEAA